MQRIALVGIPGIMPVELSVAMFSKTGREAIAEHRLSPQPVRMQSRTLESSFAGTQDSI